MQKRIFRIAFHALLLLLLFRAGIAATTVQEAFDEFVQIWQGYADGTLQTLDEHYQYAWDEFLKWGQVEAYQDTLISIAISQLQPNAGTVVKGPAVYMLGCFHNERTEAALLDLIKRGDAEEAAAAKILIKWGFWDQAAPVLEKYEMYESLGKDPRALPFLYAKYDRGTVEERYNIAVTLAYLHKDTQFILPAIHDLLRLPSDEETNKLKFYAFDIVQTRNIESEIPYISSLAIADSDAGLSIFAYGTVAYFARKNNGVAIAELENIKTNSRWMDLRERAAQTLKELGR